MPVVIREIVTEVVCHRRAGRRRRGRGPRRTDLPDEELERVVRRCTERVLEILRREWDR